MSSNPLSLLCLALLLSSAAIHGHPNSACRVSSHGAFTTRSLSSDSIDAAATNPAGGGVVVYETAAHELYGVTALRPANPTWSGTYWVMDSVLASTPALIASDVVASLAAAYATTYVVTYVGLNDSSQVLSRKVNIVSGLADPAVGVGRVGPEHQALTAGISGFYYAAVNGTSMYVFRSVLARTWTSLDTAVVTNAVSAPLAAAVDANGSYVLVYHTGVSSLGCVSLANGSSALLLGGIPTVSGIQVALTSDVSNSFMLAANNAGNIFASHSTDLGITWGIQQVIEISANVDDDSPIGLVKTAYKWVAIWINQNRDRVSFRAVATSVPDAASWAGVSVSSMFTGNATAGRLYRSMKFKATGGDGWAAVAGDTFSNVEYRACYDVYTTVNSASSSSMAVSVAVVLGLSMFLSSQ